MARMAEEDQIQKCSNGSDGVGIVSIGNRASKRHKQKRVPQRGIGVAQLEKIRLEEQRKKDAAAQVFSAPFTISATKSSYLSPPVPYYRPTNKSSASIPFAQSPTDLLSPNSVFRPPPSNQNIYIRKSSTVPLVNNLNHGGLDLEIGWLGISVPGQDNMAKLWNSCEYNFGKENSGVDFGLAFRSNLHLPFESNPLWPLPGLVQGTEQYRQQPSSMMEPPSNQSCYGNYTHMWPEKEKMVGIKRPYPFSLDNTPGLSFDFKFTTIVHPASRVDESSASYCNGSTSSFEPSIPIFREGPSFSNSVSDSNSIKSIKANGVSNGDFLTVAPPTTNLTCPSPKYKHPSAYVAFHNSKLPVYESPPYQGSMKDQILRPGPSCSNQQQQFYSFFPPAEEQIAHATTTMMNNCDGEGVSVDLSLKL